MLNKLVIVRGGGDIATGIIQKLFRSGFKILILEINNPTAIRRTVCLSEAVVDGSATVEDMTCKLISSIDEMESVFQENKIPLIIDAKGECIKLLDPLAVVDGILAKKNLGTRIDMAPIVVGIGPGFEAGVDCHVVVETMRGHDLGRLIFQGSAKKNTGIPGNIMGYTEQRVIRAVSDGEIEVYKNIGDTVKVGDILGKIGDKEVIATIDGVLRGIIRNCFYVHKGMKIGDIDPRVLEKNNCFTISDKARAVGGGGLEAVLICREKVMKNGN